MTATVYYFTDAAGFGGAEQMLITLWELLDRQRWRPVLIHHAEPGLAPLLTAARQLDIEVWPVPRMPEGLAGARRVPAFVRALRQRAPDLFHAHCAWQLANKYGLMGAVLAQGPAVLVTEQLWYETPIPWLTRLQHRWLAAGVYRYLVVSQALGRQLQADLHVPVRKIQVIVNGIQPDHFDRLPQCALRAAAGAAAGQPVILTPGRLVRQKGIGYLVQAAALIPDALFVVAGEGPDRAALEAQARALGVAERVRFVGRRADIADWLATCDVVVLPSLFEGLPLAVLEGMAAGKPVVATAVPGTLEVVTDGRTGLLVPAADPVALAAAVRRVLTEPGLAAALGTAGRAAVRAQFDARAMARAVAAVYQEALDERRR